MPIRPFKEIPKDIVEWTRFFTQTAVQPDDGSVGGDTIEDKAVTFAKVQDITPDRLLGRDSSPAGTVQELTVSGGIEFTGSGIQRSALSGDVTATAGDNATAFRDMAGVSILGRSANTTGAPADIAAATNGHYLRRFSDALAFGAIIDGDVPASIARRSSGTFTASLTGCATVPTVTVRYVAVDNVVSLFIPVIEATSNANTCTITGAPGAIHPARDQGYFPLVIRDNTTYAFGLARMSTAGVITLYPSAAATATGWTSSGTKGIESSNLVYNLD